MSSSNSWAEESSFRALTTKQSYRMATAAVFSPLSPISYAYTSSSSSHPPSAASESPESTTTSLELRYMSDAASEGVAPKIEELDEEILGIRAPKVEDASPISPTSPGTEEPGAATALVKRGRGRPRKHPVQHALPKNGRSKTGCITCRRRKKKCDERKPECRNCQLNNVTCEGYRPVETWKSGPQRRAAADAERQAMASLPRELPGLVVGIDCDLDKTLLQHFAARFSMVLTVHDGEGNPFKDMLLPMAIEHEGLMHSLLCLAGSHLSEITPGQQQFELRKMHHFDRAVHFLGKDLPQLIDQTSSPTPNNQVSSYDHTVAQTLMMCLGTICDGKTDGSYRMHMDALRQLIRDRRSDKAEFQQFLEEFFLYHDVSNSITSLDRKCIYMMEDFALPEYMIQPEAGNLLGVMDGLFGFISKIRHVRDAVRRRRDLGLLPVVDFNILGDALKIDSALRTWQCVHQPNTDRYVASMLYRLATWLYLYRTIKPSKPQKELRDAVDEGLNYLRMLAPTSSTQSIILMPLFLLGCAAFEADQRPPIDDAFRKLQEYSNLGNIRHAKDIVHRVWQMMDDDDPNSWDWETVITNMGLDFLIT